MDNNKGQRLHKVDWSRNKYGSSIGKQKFFESGEDLLRKVKLEEVVPGKEGYFIRPNGSGNCYYLIPDGFHKTANYEGIKDLVKAGAVYVYKDFNLNGK